MQWLVITDHSMEIIQAFMVINKKVQESIYEKGAASGWQNIGSGHIKQIITPKQHSNPHV
jgi:hypothetical protein